MGSTHVAREQGSCSHGCAYSGPESGVQNNYTGYHYDLKIKPELHHTYAIMVTYTTQYIDTTNFTKFSSVVLNLVLELQFR
jgi:hypothetical protein